MTFEKFEILEDRLQNYANVNAQDFEALREDLNAPEADEVKAIFEAELREAIAGAFTRAQYEALTDDEFEDDAEYQAYLALIYGYLFEGGAYPARG